MIADTVFAWSFTAWFTILGVASTFCAMHAQDWLNRGSHLVHVLMCAVMAIMPWPWSMSFPQPVSIAFFGLAAVGYATLAAGRPRFVVGVRTDHHSRPLVAWYHSAMMLGMVWMTVLMEMTMHAARTAWGETSFVLCGQQGVSSTVVLGGAPSLWNLPLWAVIITFAFATIFAFAALRFLRRLRVAGGAPGHSIPQRVEGVIGAAMAAGMAVAYFLMP